MKKLLIATLVLFACSTLFAQQSDLKAQLQAAQLEAFKYKILYEAERSKADSLIIYTSNLVKEWRKLDLGIKKSTIILQKAITENEKPDYQELILTGWNLIIPDPADKGKKPDGLP